MYNNATFVDKKQLKLLKDFDKWLSNEPWQSEVEFQTANQVRELITKIEKRGYYYEGEADVLNLMREQYIEHKKILRKLLCLIRLSILVICYQSFHNALEEKKYIQKIKILGFELIYLFRALLFDRKKY